MKRNTFVKILFTGILSISSSFAWDWCSLLGLNCPPPAQSIDLNVPREVDPNHRGLASSDQVTQLIKYLNNNLNVTVVNAGVPSFYGTDAPKETVKGVDYLFYHLTFSNGVYGINAGLIIQKYQNYSNNPQYVLTQIAQEIGATVVANTQ